MAPHIFHKGEQRLPPEQGATVHGACGLVGGFLEADGVDDAVQLALCQACLRQGDAVHLVHEPAKHTALAAAGGDDLARGALFNAGDAVARAHGCGVHFPIDGDGFDVEHRLHQPLVAQIAQHQQFRLRAQGHEGDEFTLVDIDGERPLGGNLHLLALAQFVHDLHAVGKGRMRLRQARQHGRSRGGGR
ncbi:hypothetical protein D3C71_1016380 [compost metagenome]